MDRYQEQQLRRDMEKQSAGMRDRASQDPRGESRGGGSFGEAAPARKPTAEPYAGPGGPAGAEEMGGATDQGGPPVEYGPNGERVPGPQSMFSTEDANNMVKMVRHDRLARHIVENKTPSFGEIAQQTRDDQRMAQDQAAAAPAEPAQPDPQQIAQIAQSIKFLVDTRTGHFEPILPDQQPPEPGPHDIIMSPGQDPSQPNILAKGKRVTPASIARLGDPKRAIQPTLRPGFKVPEQYQGLAQALGLDQEAKA